MAINFLFMSAVSGFLAVMLGAFGSHALKSKLDAYSLGVWQTANEYHFYHALALLLVSLLIQQYANIPMLRWSGLAFILGTVIFSGSLYVLALTQIKILGALTPIGGLCFLVAWGLLAASALKISV